MSNIHCVLDASALLKKYHPETGSDVIRTLFNREDCAIHILNVTITEVTGAFVRYQLDDEIDSTEREVLKDLFIADIRDYNVVVHNITHRNIVQTDKVWDKSIGVKPPWRQESIEKVNCPGCSNDFDITRKFRKPRIGPVDSLVLSTCLALKNSFQRIYLLTSDAHMIKVASKLNIQICDPEAIMRLPF